MESLLERFIVPVLCVPSAWLQCFSLRWLQKRLALKMTPAEGDSFTIMMYFLGACWLIAGYNFIVWTILSLRGLESHWFYFFVGMLAVAAGMWTTHKFVQDVDNRLGYPWPEVASLESERTQS